MANTTDRFGSWDQMMDALQGRCEEPRYKMPDSMVKDVVDEVGRQYFAVHNNDMGVGHSCTVLFDDGAGFHAVVTLLETTYELITFKL